MNELPTLEGRVMADLGHQVAELRAKLQQAEADNARLYDTNLRLLRELGAMHARAEQAEADNARLREALGAVYEGFRDSGLQYSWTEAARLAHDALAATPETR